MCPTPNKVKLATLRRYRPLPGRVQYAQNCNFVARLPVDHDIVGPDHHFPRVLHPSWFVEFGMIDKGVGLVHDGLVQFLSGNGIVLGDVIHD